MSRTSILSPRLLVAVLMLLFTGAGLVGSGWGIPGRDRAEIVGATPGPFLDSVKARCGEDLETRREGGFGRAIPVAPDDHAGILARICRRFLLYTHHPDEGRVFWAFSNIRPSDLAFNPGTFAYGGLFFYSLGAWYWIGAKIGLCALVPDAGFYLDHPEEMGRLVQLGRIGIMLAGALAIPVLFRIGSLLWGARGGMLLALLWAAHPLCAIGGRELKPYLPAAFLVSLSLLHALRAVRGGGTRSALAGAAFAGLAAGASPANYPVAILPILALWTAPAPRTRRVTGTVLAGLVSGLVFLLCNPFLLVSLETFLKEAAAIDAVCGTFPADLPSYGALLFRSIPLGLHPFLVPFLALGAWMASRRPGGLLCPAALGFLLLHFAVFTGEQVRYMAMVRFLFPYLPIALVLVVEGMFAVGHRFPRAGRVATATAALALAATAATLVGLHREDAGPSSTRLAAGAWIRENVPPGTIEVPTGVAPWDFPPLPFPAYAVGDMTWGTPHHIATTGREYLVRVEANEAFSPVDPAFEQVREWDVRSGRLLSPLLPHHLFWAQSTVRLYRRKGP